MLKILVTLFIGLLPAMIWSQIISGKIVDENNSPLASATILVEESNLWTTSDESGKFTIMVSNLESTVLRISYLGYSEYTRKLDFADQSPIDLGIIVLLQKSKVIENLTITALKLEKSSPFAFINIDKEKLSNVNLGKDIPYLIQNTPSLVASSDGGTGIGYSSFWIRGSDATRINVTLNGVPFNDSESLNTFWVDLPDFVSSVNDIQLQRGLGTSTNGAGAFGASINLNSINNQYLQFAEISQSIGSYKTLRSTLKLASGLIDDRFYLETRLSSINSDGYVDRAEADLKSYYLQASYVEEKFKLDFINFSGNETTYQSWYGVPQSRIENDLEGMQLHALNNGLTDHQTENLLNSDRRYNFYTYDNQNDDYRQDHYQLHFNTKLNTAVQASAVFHYTKGKGFFEEFRPSDGFADYGLESPVIDQTTFQTTDFIRRKWLDNNFYGFITNVKLNIQEGLTLISGLGYNQYRGDHFGEITWAELAFGINKDQEYYRNKGSKNDLNVYTKLKLDISDDIILYSDIQYRNINYQIDGIDNDLRPLSLDQNFGFFNPKFGLSFLINPESRLYVSYGIGNKEPNRSDFVDSNSGTLPETEQLKDLEVGYNFHKSNFDAGVNIYYMRYEDQLVLTGALNDVGSPIRENIESSYRLGLELSARMIMNEKWLVNTNFSFSRNKIDMFNELVYDYTNGVDIITNEFENTDISFSPSLIANASLIYKPFNDLELEIFSKYVSSQFLDNTSNAERSLEAYWVNDLRMSYDFSIGKFKNISLGMTIYNVLDSEYESNGYTFSYVFGDLITENFYYPQAKRHFISSLTLSF